MTDNAATLAIAPEALARLMPMHLVLDRGGRIVSAGPTLERLRTRDRLIGSRLFDHFHVRAPHGATSVADLARRKTDRLQLEFREPPHTLLKGHFVADGAGGGIVDLSFGIMVREAVATYGLTATDFAPTSLAVEILYLAEANAAAMAESRRLNQRLHDAKAAAERLAHTDALTGLKNRRGMEAVIDDLAKRGVPFALMHVDLDYFKAINDSFGHAAGDHVLTHVARILECETRDGDHVVRLGGDEFVVVFRSMTNSRRLATIARRIIAMLHQPIPFDGALCRVSASIGATTSDLYEEPEAGQMLRDADIALYRSKSAGRSQFTLFGLGGSVNADPHARLGAADSRAR